MCRGFCLLYFFIIIIFPSFEREREREKKKKEKKTEREEADEEKERASRVSSSGGSRKNPIRGQDGRVYDWMKRETKLCVVCIPSGYIALLSTHALPPEPPPINNTLHDRKCRR